MSNSAQHFYEFGPFRLDRVERVLFRHDQPLMLTPKAFDLLLTLVEHSGHVIEKEELMNTVWPETMVEESNLTHHISVLRKALGEGENGVKFIETVPKRGYRFKAIVTEIVATGQDEVAQPTLTANGPDPTVSALSPPLAGTPVPHSPRPSVARRGKPALALVVVLVLAALAITLRGWPWRAGQPAAVPRELKVARLTNGGYITNAVLAPDAKLIAYTEQDGETVHLWLRQVTGGQPLPLAELKGSIYGLTFAPDGQAVYYVMVDPGNPLGALYRVPSLGGPVTKVLTKIGSPITFAPDGKRFAFIRLDEKSEVTSLVLADLTGGSERIVLTRSGLERFIGNGPSWSPDGKEIACQLLSGMTQTSDTVWRVVGVDVVSGAQRLLTMQQWDGCGRLVWLHDGSGLVMIGTKQGESGTTTRDAVWFIAQPDGTTRRLSTDLSRHFYRSLSVSDDGQAMLVLPFHRSSQIWSLDARGQGEKAHYVAHSAVQLTTGTGEGRGGIVSLEGGSLVYVARTGEHIDLWRMNNDGSQPQQLTTDPPFLEELRAPSDGRYLVFASNRAGRSHLFRVNRDGTDLRQLTSGESREAESTCSPDGRWIVYASQASQPGQIAPFKLWKIPAEGGTPVRLTDGEAHSPHFSPDGQWISYIYPGRVGIIRSEGGALVKTFELRCGRMESWLSLDA